LVAERKSRFEGDKSTSYVASGDATTDILSSIQMCFGLVPRRWILQHVPCFRLVVGFGIGIALWLWRSRDAIGEEEDRRI
jgi:uncharacterized membrane protein